MKTLFADAGYWVALLDPRDELHVPASALAHKTARDRIVTSELVLVEVLNHFSKLGARFRQTAVNLAHDLRGEARVTVVALDAAHFDAALTLYERRSDKTWSLVDCASFLLMRERRIAEALTHDHHFEQAGFTVLLHSALSS